MVIQLHTFAQIYQTENLQWWTLLYINYTLKNEVQFTYYFFIKNKSNAFRQFM